MFSAEALKRIEAEARQTFAWKVLDFVEAHPGLLLHEFLLYCEFEGLSMEQASRTFINLTMGGWLHMTADHVIHLGEPDV